MALFDWLKGFTREGRAEAYAEKMLQQVTAPRRDLEGILARSSPLDALWKRGLEHLAVRGEVTDPYSQVGIVYTAVSTIARHLASVPFGIYRGDERYPDSGENAHPLYALFRAPNESMRGSRLWEASYSYRELRGKMFWIPDGLATGRRGGKAPTVLRVPHPDWLRPNVIKGQLINWQYIGPEGSATLSKEQVIRFAYFDPDDPYGGIGPLTAARLGYNLLWKSSKAQELFYRNGAVPPFQITMPPEESLSKPQIDALRDQFKADYLGLENYGKPPVMLRGSKLEPIGVTQKDAEWIATQGLTTTQVLAIFQVPPFLAGFADEAHLTNSIMFTRNYWGGKIKAGGNDLAAIINADICDRFYPGDHFAYDWRAMFAEVMPEETRSAVESARKMWETGVPASQAYALHGLTVDTTDLPHLEVGYIPFSMTPADQTLADSGGDAADAEEGQPAKSLLPRSHPRSDAQRASLWRSYARRLEGLERRYIGDYRKFLTWLRDATIERLTNRSVTPTGLRSIDRILRDDEASALPATQEIREEAAKKTEAAMKQSLKAGWDALLEEIGAEGAFDLLNPRVLQLITDRVVAIKGAADTIAARVREGINAGVDAGETIEQLADRIRSVISEAYRGQARTVARTETAAGFSGARREAMRESGIPKREWLSARDDAVRSSHVAVDGEIRALEEPFSNGLMYPHDPAGAPEEVINCRCVELPIVEG